MPGQHISEVAQCPRIDRIGLGQHSPSTWRSPWPVAGSLAQQTAPHPAAHTTHSDPPRQPAASRPARPIRGRRCSPAVRRWPQHTSRRSLLTSIPALGLAPSFATPPCRCMLTIDNCSGYTVGQDGPMR
jgi:hypothetical protein